MVNVWWEGGRRGRVAHVSGGRTYFDCKRRLKKGSLRGLVVSIAQPPLRGVSVVCTYVTSGIILPEPLPSFLEAGGGDNSSQRSESWWFCSQ